MTMQNYTIKVLYTVDFTSHWEVEAPSADDAREIVSFALDGWESKDCHRTEPDTKDKGGLTIRAIQIAEGPKT